MNSNKFKIIIICVDIIALIGLIYIFCVWTANHKNNEDNTDLQEETSQKTATYKKFTYKLPQEVEYNLVDEFKFKLMGRGYQAIIEIFLDDETNMFNYPEIFYNDLIKEGKNVDKHEIITINNKKVVTYKLHEDKNSTLCYIKGTPEGFAYEINLYNDDNTFNTDKLSGIIDILLNCTYDDQAEIAYEYSKWTFYEEVAALNDKEE